MLLEGRMKKTLLLNPNMRPMKMKTLLRGEDICKIQMLNKMMKSSRIIKMTSQEFLQNHHNLKTNLMRRLIKTKVKIKKSQNQVSSNKLNPTFKQLCKLGISVHPLLRNS